MMLENVDTGRSCYKQKLKVEGLSLWGDERNDILVFWICINDFAAAHHHQLVLVYVNSANVTQTGLTLDLGVSDRVKNFAKTKLSFTALDVDSFEFSSRMWTREENNCFNNFAATEFVDLDLFPGPLVFFIVICLLVIIICLVLL